MYLVRRDAKFREFLRMEEEERPQTPAAAPIVQYVSLMAQANKAI